MLVFLELTFLINSKTAIWRMSPHMATLSSWFSRYWMARAWSFWQSIMNAFRLVDRSCSETRTCRAYTKALAEIQIQAASTSLINQMLVFAPDLNSNILSHSICPFLHIQTKTIFPGAVSTVSEAEGTIKKTSRTLLHPLFCQGSIAIYTVCHHHIVWNRLTEINDFLAV